MVNNIFIADTSNSNANEIVDKSSWREFVLNHPNGNFFQCPEYYDICYKTKLYKPLIIIIKNNNEILGLLLANIQKQYQNIVGNLISRSIIIGGPLIKNNDANIFNMIIKHYNHIIDRSTIYSEFRNLFSLKDQEEIFAYNGYKNEPHLDIIVDLTKSETELWKGVNNKAKNRIRAALKKSTEFIIEDSFSALVNCYDILKEVYSRIKLPLANFDYFLNLFNTQKDNESRFIIFTSKYNNSIIGFLFAIGYKSTLYGLYNGAKEEHYNKYPNDLLPWEIFKWAKDSGYKRFDWLGAGKPGIPYGVREYKMKFGGELVNLGRFEKINKPLLYNLGKISLELQRYIKMKKEKPV